MPLLETAHGGLDAVLTTSTASSNSPYADFSRFVPPGREDARSPCPMMNALANHKFLPHNGRGISKSMVQDAASGIGADPTAIGRIFDSAKPTIPEGRTTLNLDDLAKHGVLEHNVSLSRQDIALGDNLHLDKAIWQTVLNTIGSRKSIDYATAARIRGMRFTASKQAHVAAGKSFDYDLKALLIGYIETSALFRILLGPGMSEVPVEWLQVLIGTFIVSANGEKELTSSQRRADYLTKKAGGHVTM